MHRGLDPRTRPLRWTLFLVLIGLVLAGTGGQAVSTVSDWLAHEHDRLPWYATRATALLAYLALAASVVYGLLLSTGLLDALTHRTVSFTLHQDLASIGLGLALVHAALLMIDRSVPFSPAEVVVPLIGPYRPVWVALGQVALLLSVVIVASFYLRRRIGQRSWRRLHSLSFAAFLGATAHGLMTGTDTAAAWVFWGYLVMVAIVVFLLTYRLVLAAAARRGHVVAPPASLRRAADATVARAGEATPRDVPAAQPPVGSPILEATTLPPRPGTTATAGSR